MENTAQFDLAGALRQWNADMAAQPGLSPEARHELEAHLHDTVRELCGNGLNAEESFWLACRRIGAPIKLGEEFAKANPSSVWRTRVLWVAGALLAMRLIEGAFAGVGGALAFLELHEWAQAWWVDGLRDGLGMAGVRNVLGALVVICLAGGIARRPIGSSAGLWRLFFQSKWRFMISGTLAVMAVFALEVWSDAVRLSLQAMEQDTSLYIMPISQDAFSKLTFPLFLVILITGLIPTNRPARTQSAPTSRLTKA
jgi:hypothetical protein